MKFACSRRVFMARSRHADNGTRLLMLMFLEGVLVLSDLNMMAMCTSRSKKGIQVAYLLLYVDDLLVVGAKMSDVQEVKDDLRSAFEMNDLG